MSETIDQFSICELLEAGEHYLIPTYQRNYAWEEGEITQLIQDILDQVPRQTGQSAGNYYIGTLVVFDRARGGHSIFETIDGQQRLTTLSLLVAYLKNRGSRDTSEYFGEISGVRLDFDCRENSRRTFEAIDKGEFEIDPDGRLSKNETNTGILNGYRIIGKVLPLKLQESGVQEQEFVDYLLNRVQIMRVPVPRDTDLNHYFEVMNSRGEQLEKHEVLKSRLLKVLSMISNESERRRCRDCLHIVWEACSNMERYVQMGFNPQQRGRIFGEKDWGSFVPRDFDHLIELLGPVYDEVADHNETLDQILCGERRETDTSRKEEDPERFNTVINFQNFLLHALRVEWKQAGADEIPLDDKRLLDTFERVVIKAGDPLDCVKRFTYSLLKSKFLLDQYMIKREFIKGSDGWSLKRMRWSEGSTRGSSGRPYYAGTFGDEGGGEALNRRILMLLSAFHVSTPTMVYKYWLSAALMHLYHRESIDGEAYREYLESVARAFVFDRFLSPTGGLGYYEIIHLNNGECQARRDDFASPQVDETLTFGQIQSNLVFNYLDYLLWCRESDPKVKAFEFTFRSSVEHYYPQNPKPGFDRLPPEALNMFGNLCLISHSKNSTLSNFMPAAKKEYYEKNPIDSIKQYLMMANEPWNEAAIHRHHSKMKEVLLQALPR